MSIISSDRFNPSETPDRVEVFEPYRFYQESIMFIVCLLPDILVYGSQRIKPPDTAPSSFSCSSLLLFFFVFVFAKVSFTRNLQLLGLLLTVLLDEPFAPLLIFYVRKPDILSVCRRETVTLDSIKSTFHKIASKVPKSSNALILRSYTMQCKGCIRPLY